MAVQRVSAQDLAACEVLPFDLFDADGALVLMRGMHAPPAHELAQMLARGLFCNELPHAASSISAPVSVLRTLNDCCERLEKLLPELSSQPAPAQEVMALVALLDAALDLNPDVALACVLLQQIGGVYSVRHCLESALLALLLARSCNLDDAECTRIAASCLTMNIGMLDMHDSLQLRRHQLDDSEIQRIRHHPEISINLLRQAGIDDAQWLEYVLHHHENEDGSGYPFGKQAAAIPPGARIIALADRYCAQVASRNYRQSLTPQQACATMRHEFGAPHEQALLGAFLREIGEFPPGSRVLLADGALAVVSHRRAGMPPLVHRLRDAQGQLLTPPQLQDARDNPIQRALHEADAPLRFAMKKVWGEHATL